MEGNSGLPPEIMVLCTTTETKERAIRLLEWIQGMPDLQYGLAREPAIPAVCSLIASEQLGNTVVTERRAQQWSRSTPEHFRTIMNDVQKLLMASRAQSKVTKQHLTFQSLVDECCQGNALDHMVKVEEVFRKAPASQRWPIESESVQAAIFFWTCRWFKIPTSKSVEDIQKDYNIFPSDFRAVEALLDATCADIRPSSSDVPLISAVASSSRVTASPSESHTITPSDGATSGTNPVSLQDLALEFEVGEDAMGGIRFLETKIREKEELKDLVDWESTMGRCVIFYWTCSVLKIPSAKHITLRNQYQLSKKDFDRLITVLDLHRSDLRKRLEEFYAGNPALQLLPQSTQWPATSPANLKPQALAPAAMIIDEAMSPSYRNSSKGTGRRGRPPKTKTPPPISTEPASLQEESLFPLCQGPAIHRALVLLRSFNARRLPASDADRVPPKSLPALVALLASEQLGNGQVNETMALQASYLTAEEFSSSMASVRASIDNFHPFEEFAKETAFDSLALEHGMSIDAIASMLQVRDSLKDSRCLSIGMDWDSPLVTCSVFFWTCAILKVPDVKQSRLRSLSLSSKREFDSMLQLLNSHCSVIRHRLEGDFAAGKFWHAPPPSGLGHFGRRHPSFYGEQEIYLEELDGRPSKRVKRETSTPSDYDADLSDGRTPRKPRHASTRRPRKRDEASGSGNTAASGSQAAIYRPTVQFPPADWIPPESLSRPPAEAGAHECPPMIFGGSTRRLTRYKTQDYQHVWHQRYEAWKPEGEDVRRQLVSYQHWVGRMSMKYGPRWEEGISRVDQGQPFE